MSLILNIRRQPLLLLLFLCAIGDRLYLLDADMVVDIPFNLDRGADLEIFEDLQDLHAGYFKASEFMALLVNTICGGIVFFRPKRIEYISAIRKYLTENQIPVAGNNA